MFQRSLVRACVALVVVLAMLPSSAAAGPGPVALSGAVFAKIEPKLAAQLGRQKEATVWVLMKAKADLRAADDIAGWDERGAFVVRRLAATARQSQTGVRAFLTSRGIPHRTFFIANAIKVTATRAVVEQLAGRSDVRRIIADGAYQIPRPKDGEDLPDIRAVEWGIASIRADEAWSTFGVRGEGIVVANIDTGVQFDHPALVGQYRGNLGAGGFSHDYNWFDPSAACGGAPCDDVFHGTHVMGTMVGNDATSTNQIGVAPEARWMAAKGCEFFGCSFTSLIASGEWILAPTRLDGSDPDPAMRPHIVNNSWGGGPADDFYKDIVDAWVAAGIFPAFAAGNAGPGCRSAGSPGDYAASYAAGAFDDSGRIAFFSSRGPSAIASELKPDIAAPGVNVRSSVPGDGYEAFNGTSMASPHVAGAIALAWSAAPSIVGDVVATRTLLATAAIDTSDLSCGGTPERNNVWGEGRLDAYALVDRSPRLPTGTLSGVITAADGGAPIQGAMIVAAGSGTTRTAFSDAAGGYELTLHRGTYEVSVSAFGFLDKVESNVAIAEAATTDQDFALSAAPAFTVSGTVRDESGAPRIGAVVAFVGTPLGETTTDASGDFAFANVPVGTYELRASADGCTEIRTIDLTVDGAETVPIELGPKRDARGHFCTHVPAAYRQANTRLQITGDDMGARVELPFPFTFYGATYGAATVTTNGFLSFTDSEPWFANGSLPSTAPPNAAVYAFWDDLFADRESAIYTRAGGTAPARWFIVEWRGITFFDSGARIDAEAVLHEDGQIALHYRRIASGNPRERGASATIGIEDAEGKDAFLYSLNEPVLSGTQAILFDLPPNGFAEGTVVDATHRFPIGGAKITALRDGIRVGSTMTDEEGRYRLQLFVGSHRLRVEKDLYSTTGAIVSVVDGGTTTRDFSLASPRADIPPGDVTVVLPKNQTFSKSFTLRNVGRRDLTFEVKEGNVFGDPGGGGGEELPPGVTSRRAPADYEPKRAASTHFGGPVLVLMDQLPWGSEALPIVLSENGIPFEVSDSSAMERDLSSYEAVFISSDQPQQFYDTYRANLANLDAYVRAGGFLWFGAAAWGFNGGDLTGAELPGGATVTGLSPAPANEVTAPEHPLMQGVPDPFTGTDASHTTFADLPAGTTVIATDPAGDPTLIEYDHGDGRVLGLAQTLEFAWMAEQDGKRILENGIPYAYIFESYTDIPWLSGAPLTGSIAPGASRRITVTVNTRGLEAGLYRARLVLLTNDPVNQVIQIPVTVIVPEYQRIVNAGGPAVTDPSGQRWQGDRRYATGSWGYTNRASYTVRIARPIAGTSADIVYQDLRRDPTEYRFTVPDGTYRVELGFAEIMGAGPNVRVFDVILERRMVLPAHDIASEVGQFRANNERFTVRVTDGVLNVRLVPRAGFRPPVINAIEVTHRPDLG